MKKVVFRILSTLIALGIASVIIYVLSHAGKSTKGPIETAMTYTGDAVKHMEESLIMDKRSDKREDKLQWLQPYYNDKKLLVNPDRVLFGAFDNDTREGYESIIALEDSLKTTFPLIHIFTAWGSKPDERFPKDRVENIIALGSIPVITWEPWLSDFNDEEFPCMHDKDRDKNGMRDVAAGMYDTYIKRWANNAKRVNRTIFIRLGHEMNDGYRYPWGPQNNAPADFIAAWHHVHDLFLKQGAKNVIWIWSPHPAYECDEFYPGDAYVDYIGAGLLNYGTVATWSKWWTFKEMFIKFYKDVAPHKKPIMITEFGSLAVGGNRARWYHDALDSLPQRYPLVKSILYFHFSKDNTTTQQTLNWYIKNDSAVTATIIKEVGRWKY